LQFYWLAFNDLTSERQIGMGIGPIPYSALRAYATEYGIRGHDEFDYFRWLLQAMDNHYLAHVNSSERESTLIPISDVTEQHRMFSRLQERSKVAKK
jgi:hypothetical protein